MCPSSLSDQRLSPIAQASLHAISWPDFVPPAIRAGYIDLALVLHHQLIEKAPSDGQAAHPVSVIGVAGSVSAGKTTLAHILQLSLQALRPNQTITCVSTDHFLHTNQHIEAHIGMHQKGFPASYRYDEMVAFVDACQHRRQSVYTLPQYSHQAYDIGPTPQTLPQPDVLIVEGVVALQDPPGNNRQALHALCNASVYIDVDPSVLWRWFLSRFEAMRHDQSTKNYYQQWAHLSIEEAERLAWQTWQNINLVNLKAHIAPSQKYADWTVVKDRHHAVVAMHRSET